MRCTLAALLCWLWVIGQAQQSTTLPNIRPDNEWFFKISPFSFAESDGGIALTGEYILQEPRLGLQLEAQPIFFTPDSRGESGGGWESPINTIQSGNPLGIKLRPEVRYYFHGVGNFNRTSNTMVSRRRFSRRNANSRSYIALDFLYKYTQRERIGRFGAFNGGSTPAFQRLITYTDIKNVYGVDFKVGSMWPAFDSQHWYLETYLGFGIRFKKFSYRDLPAGVSEPSRRRVINWWGNRNAPNNLGLTRSGVSLPIGIKVAYKL